MSYQDYEEALRLMKDNEEFSDFVGERPGSLVKRAEDKLNVQFPATYRNFLLNYGAGNFGAEEIYGVIDDSFEHSAIPNGIWLNLDERSQSGFPEHLVIIYHTGFEEYFCLDFSKLNEYNEPPVVSYVIGVDLEDQVYEIIASDFGEFLLDRVKSQINSI